MLKHMLTPTSPGPRAQPIELGLNGGPLARHHHHHNHTPTSHHLHNNSIRNNHHPQQLNISVHSQRLNHSHALSTLSTSKHSLGGNSSSVSPGINHQTPVLTLVSPQITPIPKLANGGLHISRRQQQQQQQPLTATSSSQQSTPPHHHHSKRRQHHHATTSSSSSSVSGVREMLTSLGLLCLVSLLLALLALIFLLKISPAAEVSPNRSSSSSSSSLFNQDTIISFEEYVVVYEVTLALCALTLSLNLCCLLVCAIQFLFAVKLTRSSQGGERTNKYLQKSSVTRVLAVGGFFISIPVFLTGIILYTFIQFHSTPAIITSVFIGLGIIFCGCAMVHNVFVWQREKTNEVKLLAQQRVAQVAAAAAEQNNSIDPRLHFSMRQDTPASPGMPNATLDLSSIMTPHELSTLV